MELVCFICQEHQSEIGHQTSSCPKVACKRCGQNGHFGMNCEIRGTADEENEIEAIERFDNGVTGQSFSEPLLFDLPYLISFLKLNYRKKAFYFALNFLSWQFLLKKSWISKN